MSKSIHIVLPNSNVINTIIGQDDGALFIYNKIQEVNPGFNENNIKIKKDLTEDDIKSGEKEYDFGNIREGERILTFIIEPCNETLEDVIYLTRLKGLNFFSYDEYVQSCRYHFKITNPIYQITKSFSVLYDNDFKKFSLEPSFHKGNWSVLIDLKPFMSCVRPVFDGSNYSLNYNPVWYDTIRDLLSSYEEEGWSFSEESINNIEQLYEKHKLRI